ncbi:MAG: TlpA disulfide reductase family protein [Paludibacter sp.]|nr:TlpA disulfide reductase family protein [Paludibacter sp.]
MKIFLIILTFVFSSSLAAQTTDDRAYLVKVGDMAPNFSMKLTNGKILKLSELKGKVVMLQFTASWCSVCRREMPFIERDIWQKHKSNPNFVLMAVDRDEPLQTVRNFAKSIPISYPIGLDPKADIFALYALREAGITRNVIIDKTGKIVFLTRLYDEAEFKKMTEMIDGLLK